MPEPMIPKHGGYRNLRSFQVAQRIYDLTVAFCDLYIEKRSRTHDQMVQAARSGTQNIAEGSKASATSKKIELKLTSIARASLEELLLDYEDFLRHRGLRLWSKDETNTLRIRAKLKTMRTWFDLLDQSDLSDPLDLSDFAQLQAWLKSCSSEEAANTAICMIHQATFLLRKQLESLDAAFLREGGFTERLYRSRSQARRESDRSD